MTRREFLIYGSIFAGSVGISTVCRLLSPTSSPISEQLEREDREWYEKHKRVANLLFAAYEKYINVNTDRDFYNYARGLIEAGQFSSYKEDIYGIVFPWVIRNPLETPGFQNQIGLAINYPEERKIGGSLYVHAQSDQNVTTVYKPFIALYMDRDLKVLRDRDGYQNMRPFNEEDFANIWPNIFTDPPPTYDVRERKYTRGNLEAVSENNLRDGKNVTYSIYSDGMVRIFVE